MTSRSFDPMDFTEKLDLAEQKHRHEMERMTKQNARDIEITAHRVREARQETWKYVGIAFAAAMVVIAITVAIYYGVQNDPPPTNLTPEERREYTCVDKGGSYIPPELLADTSAGLCVYPKGP